MKNFDNKPRSQQIGDLFTYSLAPFLVEAAEELSNWFEFRINVECVLSEFSRYTWHVRRFPCKNVPVLMDELDERAFLFRIQVSADAKLHG